MRGDSRLLDTTLETINAAATAIASADNRVTIQKKRWGSWGTYWCFGSHKHKKRIGHAVLVPEPTPLRNDAPTSNYSTQASSITRPFVAPPSSPASFLQSEPPSVTQSPAATVSLNSISVNMYSPPTSIFAIGPYAHETQLVSPPVFSTFTTEPSTAPFTPPPESVHLTTPSSPEVPFAQLLDSSLQNVEAVQRFPFSHYEFQSYHLYPGSQLISPSSGVSGSGTSSPFPDNMSSRAWRSYQGSGGLTPESLRPRYRNGYALDRQLSDAALHMQSDIGYRNDQIGSDHRVSFELSAEDVKKCVAKKPPSFVNSISEECFSEDANSYERRHCVGEENPSRGSDDGEEAPRHKNHKSVTLGSCKEFNFDNTDGGEYPKTSIGSDWWANEKVVGTESGTKDWSFFPVMQPGVS